jgi:hypothetical protein
MGYGKKGKPIVIQDPNLTEINAQMAQIANQVPLSSTTSEIQSTLDANSKILFLDGDYIVDSPIYFKSNQTIMFSPNTVFKAAVGGFTGDFDSLINIHNQSNVKLINKLKVVMNKAEYTTGEWRHGVNIQSVKGLDADIIEVSDTGGDGVYFGTTDNISVNEDINIKTIIVDNNKRNGVSFICGKRIKIDNVIATNTNGTYPMYGIDFEPNTSANLLQDIEINNVFTSGNSQGGILFQITAYQNSTESTTITIHNFHSINDGRQGALSYVYSKDADTSPMVGEIAIKRGLIEDPKCEGVNFQNYTSNGIPLLFENITIVNPGTDTSYTSPFDLAGFSMQTYETDSSVSVGNMRLVNCKVIDNRTTPRLSVPYHLVSAAKPLKNITFINCDGENQTNTSVGLYQLGEGDYHISSEKFKVKSFTATSAVTNFQGMTLTNSSASSIDLYLPSVTKYTSSIYRFRVTNGPVNIRCSTGEVFVKNNLGAYKMNLVGDYLVIKATNNGWEVLEEFSQPLNNITNNPSFIGQLAFVDGVAYIATALNLSGWKQITS